MMASRKFLSEMFLTEHGPSTGRMQADVNSGTSVAKSPQRYSSSTAKMQSDVDSSTSVAKKGTNEAAGSSGLRITGDKPTMGALMDALHAASADANDNPDLAEWCERAFNAVGVAIRSATEQVSVTLPEFQETQGMDDTGEEPEEGDQF